MCSWKTLCGVRCIMKVVIILGSSYLAKLSIYILRNIKQYYFNLLEFEIILQILKQRFRFGYYLF